MRYTPSSQNTPTGTGVTSASAIAATSRPARRGILSFQPLARSGLCPATASLIVDAEPGKLAVQCRWIDAEHFRGARLVSLLALEHPLDVGALDDLERRIRRAPFRHQRLGSPFGDVVGKSGDVD